MARIATAALRRLDAVRLFRTAKGALEQGDRGTAMVCLQLFGGRTTCKARELETKLQGLLGRGLRSPTTAKLLGVVTDLAIRNRRENLIRSASRSIWLSSLTLPSRELCRELGDAASQGIRVVVIADASKVRGAEDRLALLKRAGIESRLIRGTHSKLVIVDERYVMNGSANAHGGYRDVCDVQDDPTKARELIAYLDVLRPSWY